MKTFEYQVRNFGLTKYAEWNGEDYKDQPDDRSFSRYLDQEGKCGWELVSCFPFIVGDDREPNTIKVVMKRASEVSQ